MKILLGFRARFWQRNAVVAATNHKLLTVVSLERALIGAIKYNKYI